MELLFESRPEIVRVDGQLYFFQCQPRIHPDPVLIGDSPVDATGASIYGSVIRDNGRYRMWYQAWPEDHTVEGIDSALVGYAESADGITWQKPILDRVEYKGSRKNNLVNLGVGTPSVFIDPVATSSHRDRATGCIYPEQKYHFPFSTVPPEGYYTFHSTDGVHWEIDSIEPRWLWSDNIFSIWHPARGQGELLVKRARHMGGMLRRSYYSATLREGIYSDWKVALVPDDYDDILARQSGHLSADYYGVAMMPAGLAMVGFIVQFRHRHPLGCPKLYGGVVGSWGETDITLAYQAEEGAQWLHTPGRPDFLTHGAVPWARNGWYVGSNVVECGDEQRLYVTGAVGGHMLPRPEEKMMSRIGFVSWPKWRLFEFRAEPKGELEIDLGILRQPSELILNYKAHKGGSVRAQIISAKPLFTLEEVEGRNRDDCIPLIGDKLGEAVRWKNGEAVIESVEGRHAVVRLFLEHASVFAYEVRPAKTTGS